MHRRNVTVGILILLVVSSVLQGGEIFPLQIFTNNGAYYDDPGVKLTVEVIDRGDEVEFLFANNSSIDFSVARIYINSLVLTGNLQIENGPGTSFVGPAKPAYLPSSKELVGGKIGMWSARACSPLPANGIWSGEWLKVYLELKDGASYSDLVGEIETGTSGRIGAHLIAFPDGSSEGAVTPEPSTIGLLGLGALALVFKR